MLSSPVRISLLRAVVEPTTVSRLVEITGLTQPLVSQHLRVLRLADMVTVTRRGREAYYEVVDRHVTHVVEDAIAHAAERVRGADPPVGR